MKLGIYTHGGPSVGLGHVFRCVAFATNRRVAATFSSIEMFLDPDPADGGATAARILREEGRASVRLVAAGATPTGTWDLLLLDRLRVPRELVKRLRASAGVVVSLDDTGDGRYFADIAASPVFGPQVAAPASSGTVTLEGVAPQVLHDDFLGRARREYGPFVNLYLTQGGADPHGQLPRLVAHLLPFLKDNPQITLYAHHGPAFRHQAQLAAVLREAGERVRLFDPGGARVAGMVNMDVAVSAAGISSFELAALGVPTVLTTAEAKEVETAKRLEDAGAAIFAGFYDEATTPRLLHRHLTELRDPQRRRALGTAAAAAVDGRGADRILDAALGILAQRRISEGRQGAVAI